ncbi:MAG: transcriptional regulator [Flavobacteriales bacterium]|nr:transcriptional regulator [Flavobacteriales bacterium]
MKATIIKTEEQYEKVLKRIDEIFDAKPNTKEFDELELLSMLVGVYEEEHYHIEAPTPIEAIKFRMEQEGLNRTDLIPFLGTRSRVSEILNGKRKLTVDMMKNLYQKLGVPAESLLA